jgi:hypothetical protein
LINERYLFYEYPEKTFKLIALISNRLLLSYELYMELKEEK